MPRFEKLVQPSRSRGVSELGADIPVDARHSQPGHVVRNVAVPPELSSHSRGSEPPPAATPPPEREPEQRGNRARPDLPRRRPECGGPAPANTSTQTQS